MSDKEKQEVAAPELTVVDLQNIQSVINLASRRGAFAAGEMEAVGAIFNKLSAFLAAVVPQETAQEAPNKE